VVVKSLASSLRPFRPRNMEASVLTTKGVEGREKDRLLGCQFGLSAGAEGEEVRRDHHWLSAAASGGQGDAAHRLSS
jgi:hypothetical protein